MGIYEEGNGSKEQEKEKKISMCCMIPFFVQKPPKNKPRTCVFAEKIVRKDVTGDIPGVVGIE